MAILPWVDISAKGRCTPLTESIVFFVEIMLTFKRVTRAALVAGIALFPCAAAYAAPNVYHCGINDTEDGSLIQPKLTIRHDVSAGVAEVQDRLILRYNGGQPLAAKVVSDTTKETRLRWTIKQVRNGRGQLASLRYEAKYNKADGSLRLTVRPSGYTNYFNYKGACKTE